MANRVSKTPGAQQPSEASTMTAFVERACGFAAMTDRAHRLIAVSRGWRQAAPQAFTAQDLLGAAADVAADGGLSPLPAPETETRWLKWSASPWMEAPGRPGGLVIQAVEITGEVHEAERAGLNLALAEAVLERSPAPMVVKDHEGRVRMINRAMLELYGASELESLGKTMFEIFPAELAASVDAEDRRALASDRAMVVDELAHALPGGERVLRKTKVAVRGASGPPLLLAVTEDLTERRRIERQLEEARTFLGALVENVPLPLVVKRLRDGRIVQTNKAQAAFMGRATEDLIGKTAEELFPPEQAARMRAQDQEVVDSGEVNVADVTMTTAHGVRLMRTMKLAFDSAEGEKYILTINQDMTDVYAAQKEVERTRAFLEQLFEALPIGVAVKDAEDLRLLMNNPASDRIFCIPRNANVGKTLYDIFPPEVAELLTQADRAVIESGEMDSGGFDPIETPEGVKFVRGKKVVVRSDGEPAYLMSIFEDVTDLKRAQDELTGALARAEAANVAKSEFLANMSHEIRTPLNGVLGLADALARKDLAEDQREIVGMIVSSGQALNTILSDVLDLAKAEAGQLQLSSEPMSLRETIATAAFLFRSVAEDKSVGFSVRFEGGPDRLAGDSVRIKQIVSNLISNAVKFTSEGEVQVTTRVAQEGDEAAIEITVQDTGCGFSEEAAAKLFGRFEQGDTSVTRRYGGTGLGLSIARSLAQMMGGDIGCSARPGEGATFVFTARLAIASAASGQAPTDVPHPEAAAGARRLRILLAEDHPVNQKVVQLMIGEAADLTIVANGAEALDLFASPQVFDVILMDTQMPVMDGLTAIRRIRALEAGEARTPTPIVSLTANAMVHQVEASLEAGADVHLPKPITADGLASAIERAMALADEAPLASRSQGVG